jgi:hypothetical protein
MAMRTDIRIWTAIALIAICAFSIIRGWTIVHFSLATANIDVFENLAEVFNPWMAVPEVASAAFQAELKEEINISDVKAANGRRETFSSMLSIRPASSLDWLSLSSLEWVTHQPMGQVLRSLELSMLTGPNESYVMAERGILGVMIWKSLSPELKNRVARDLAVLRYQRTPAEGAQNAKFRAVLSKEPDFVRNELREAFVSIGLAPKEIEQRLGF